MKILSSRIPFVLLIGDLISFVVSLWLSLLIRYGDVLDRSIFYDHLLPFSFLFLLWLLVFLIAGLYEKRSVVLKATLATTLIKSQLVNTLIAMVFFYLVPSFGITPKTNLFVYIIISSAIIFWWRFQGYYFTGAKRREDAFLISGGSDARELKAEIDGNKHYAFKFASSIDVDALNAIDFQEEVLKKVYADEISVIVVDLHNPKIQKILPSLYNLIFSRVRFIDMHRVYEDVFNRVPLSLVRESWFLENISTAPKIVYDSLKRVMDVSVSIILGIISLVLYPFVALFIKLEDKGPVFIFQDRIGKNNSQIKICKFRSMSLPVFDAQGGQLEQKVTRVGQFIRKTRIDELPQLWNVIIGDLSLIGPRPELPSFVKQYDKDIPFYNVRHLIKPGLSGWAQLRHKNPPKFSIGFEETKMKLSYDLYYIKNRSLTLDLTIALKTIKELLTRGGI